MADGKIGGGDFRGYVSPEAKKAFILSASVLGMLFLAALIAFPQLIATALPTAGKIDFTTQFEQLDAESAALWKGDLWYVSRRLKGIFEDPAASPELRLLKLTDHGPEVAYTLAGRSAWLAAREDALWIISEDGISAFDGTRTRHLAAKVLSGLTSRPFLLGDRLAVIQETPGERVVRTLDDGEWREAAKVHVGDAAGESLFPDRLKAAAVGEKPYLFLKKDRSVYCYTGWPGESVAFPAGWEPVGFAEKAWAVGVLGGKPAMLTSRTPEGDGKSELIGFVRDAGGWRQFFTCPIGYPPTTVGFVGGDGAAFQVLYQSVPWSLNVIRVEGDKVLSKARFDGAFPFTKPGGLLVLLPPLSAMIAPVFLALVLSRLMQKYRERFYSGAGAPIPYASLGRRVAALAIDAAIAVGPLAAALGYALPVFADLEDNPSESRMALALALIVGGLAWAGLALILFTYSTGRWGRTPGKSALGIRVLGGDLQPCGFGRAVLRTLLLLPDAFLNFMVGILLIAFTAHWQRLGDLAAKTIVVREVPLDHQDPKTPGTARL